MFSCPISHDDDNRIRLAHGGGGEMTARLIHDIFLPAFGSGNAPLHDSTVILSPGARLAVTTDGFVVHPSEFPGGDIGSLAVHGTLNDLAMSGAHPLYLTTAFILEEGLDRVLLQRIAQSMGSAARRAGVSLVAGDTKVVERGKGDGIYIATTGIGVVEHGQDIGPSSIRPGDSVLVSGDLGRHGATIMNARAGINVESELGSDSASVWPAVSRLLDAKVALHCLRDITRGGLAMTLNELAEDSGTGIVVREKAIPVSTPVRASCDLLGLDPLQAACEGRFIAIVPEQDAARTLDLLREDHPEAALIGTVGERRTAPLLIDGLLGVRRVLAKPLGEQLPRIC